MARGVNKVIIVGNVGQDPESRSFPDGASVTNVSVATSEAWRDKQTGQMQERTEWHRIVFRDRGNFRLGQIASQYLRKGSKVYVEGSLRTRKWQDQNGQDRYTTEIIANELQMLDSRPDGMQGGMQQGGYAQQPAAQPMNNYQQPQQQAPAAQQQPAQAMPQQAAHQQAPMGQQPQGGQPQSGQQPQQARVQPQTPPQQPAYQQNQPVPSAPAFDDFDDDIPF